MRDLTDPKFINGSFLFWVSSVSIIERATGITVSFPFQIQDKKTQTFDITFWKKQSKTKILLELPRIVKKVCENMMKIKT